MYTSRMIFCFPLFPLVLLVQRLFLCLLFLLANNRRICFRYFLQISLRDSGTLFNVPCSLNSSLFSNHILLGDFNVNYPDPTSFLYTLLHSMISSFDLTQVVQEPTRVIDNRPATLIDLALLWNPSCCEECSIIPPLSNCDRNGVSLMLKWGIVKKYQSCKVQKYSQANFDEACALIDSTDWDTILQGDCIDKIWD